MSFLVAVLGWLLSWVMVDPAPVEIDPIPAPVDPTAEGAPPIDSISEPAWLPDPATQTQYTGTGPRPVWDDVYNHTVREYDAKIVNGWDISEGRDRRFVTDAIHTAMGEIIKSMSGFVNRTVGYAAGQIAQVYSTLQFVLADLDDTNQEQFRRIHQLQLEVNGLSTIVAYEEQQIVALKETIFDAVEFEGAYLQDWARRTILDPLFTELVRIGPETDRKILLASRNVLDQAHLDAVMVAVPAYAAIRTITRTLSALQTESDECVKPMCSTMGPNTPLGKLLKALEAAGFLALLVELGNLRADGLDGLITELGDWGTRVIDEFESLFFAGGRTLAETLAGLPG